MIEVPTGVAASARALLARVQRGGGDLTREYPLVFDDGAPGQVLALSQNDQVVAGCTVLCRDFLFPDGSFVRGGLIGAVSTDEEHRGRGLGTRMLAEAESLLAREGAFFALLWADDPDFYLERGYVPVGVELDWSIDDELARCLPAGEEIEPARPGDAGAVHGLYGRHATRIARTQAETAALLGCPNMTTLLHRRAGRISAYACLGRGADFPGVVHEWGGPTTDVLSLVRVHHEQRNRGRAAGATYLVTPPDAHDLHTALEDLGAPRHLGFLGLAKLTDLAAAVRWLDERLGARAHARLTTTPMAIEIADGDRRIALAPEALLSLLFPAAEARSRAADLLAEIDLADVGLPLAPFAWGLDSI